MDQTGPEWKLVMVGDAAMHPAELLGGGDWEYTSYRPSEEQRRGIEWMQLLRDTYKKCVWINPEPPSYWRAGTAKALSDVFPMFELTLDGLGQAVAHLSKGQSVRR